MPDLPARKRRLRAVRRLDHEAVDARLDASLLDYGRVSREAGLTSDEAVKRLRRLFEKSDDQQQPPRPPPIRPRAVLLVAAAVAVVGIVWLIVTDVGSTTVDRTVENPGSSSTAPAGVEGSAEILVSVYLGQAGEGTENVLDDFLTEPVQLPGLVPGRLYVQNVATVDVQPTDSGWTVAVAAQVLRRIEGGYGDPTIQYYQVDVLRGDGYLSPTTPTLIGKP